MTTSIARDTFIQSLVTSLKRELYIETEDHVRFLSYDPLILLHVWREGEEYLSGFSERLSGPSTEIWANSLTPIKQWLVMDNVDLLRWYLGLERFGIRFRNLLVAPHWSHRPGTTCATTTSLPASTRARTHPKLPHSHGSSTTRLNDSSRSPTSKAPRKPARPSSACRASPSRRNEQWSQILKNSVLRSTVTRSTPHRPA